MVQGASIDRGGLLPSSLLAILASRGPTSRADLARALDVSAPTVTQIVRELLARGLVVEHDTVTSQGGRPARPIGLAVSAGGALGVKITHDHVGVVDVALDGSTGPASTIPFDPTRPDSVDRLAQMLGDAVTSAGQRLLGVGVGVPGAVDAQDSGVVTAPTLGWDAVPVGQLLRSRLGIPVLVENDVNTLAVADRLYGAGREHNTYLVVTIGRGIGCGMVIDGSIYRGAFGGAGEIGHIPVEYPGGRDCSCGSVGCLEAWVGDAGLLRTAREAHVVGRRTGLSRVVDLARGGDSAAQSVFTDAGAMLGAALAGVVHTVDPEVIILSGEGISAWSLWEPGFVQEFRRHLLPRWRAIPLVVEAWDETKWMIGAASLVLAAPFDAVGVAGIQGRLVRDRLQDADGRSA